MSNDNWKMNVLISLMPIAYCLLPGAYGLALRALQELLRLVQPTLFSTVFISGRSFDGFNAGLH
jgi:hypothetical protein